MEHPQGLGRTDPLSFKGTTAPLREERPSKTHGTALPHSGGGLQRATGQVSAHSWRYKCSKARRHHETQVTPGGFRSTVPGQGKGQLVGEQSW